jgi:sugar lactone lactonase YvrE
MKDEIRCVAPTGDICGEGAVWHLEERALYWTDINRFLVHRFEPHSQTTLTWFFEEPVTSVNLTTNTDIFVLVFASQIGLWSPGAHPRIRTIFRLPSAPEMRFNDARVDPRGSLWAGTMRNNVGPRGEDLTVEFTAGVLYRIDPDGAISEWKNGVGISNAIAWSHDRKTFYFGDSPANVIYSFAYDDRTGKISDEKQFFVGHGLGAPDGSATDQDGFLWNARPDAGCLIRIAPDGRIDRIVRLPVSKPTTCTFGGSDRKTLYVTSARSAEQYSGSVFALETGVQGLQDGRFLLPKLPSAQGI